MTDSNSFNSIIPSESSVESCEKSQDITGLENSPVDSQDNSQDSTELSNIKNIYVTPELVLEWKEQFLREEHSFASTETYFSFISRFVRDGITLSQKAVSAFRNNNMSSPCSGALKNFFNYLVKHKEYPQEILHFNYGRSKTTKRFPESVQTIEVQKIIEGMPTLKEKLFTMLLFELGLRISEGIKLKWEDFNYATWLLDRTKFGVVNIKNTKRGKFRSLPVHPEIMELLYNAHTQRSSDGIPLGNLLFNFEVERFIGRAEFSKDENLYHYVRVVEKRYRVHLNKVAMSTIGRKVNPHKFRHAKAQELMNKGLPIESLKNFLGHEKITSTEIYAQASSEKLLADLQKIL